MGASFVFCGPNGNYTITLPDCDRYEDEILAVSCPSGEHAWRVFTEGTNADGGWVVAGMTSGTTALWFELPVTNPVEITYWGDQVIVRKDKRWLGE